MFSAPRRTFITVINQAEVAYREFLGANRIRLEPGLRLDLPLFHTVRRIDMREAMIPIPELSAYTKDNVPVKVTGTLFYRPVDAEKACYEVRDFRKSVGAVGESSFRAVVGRFEFDEIIANRNSLNTELANVIGTSLDKWGVACSRCEVQHVGPQNKEIATQLEKQMEAERRRRENELDTQAHIRTAEGAKQQAVLVSEGELVAARNRAQAMQFEMETEARALASQVKALGDAIESPARAAEILLEMKRLEHLKAIAGGQNRVYFVDPRGTFPGTVATTDLIKKSDLE
jgi:regulator of protease activity HflC (stomatin/prohibitin superfamily)